MPGESKPAVYAAIGADLAIAVSKGLAAAFTGSSAMLAETVHSLVVLQTVKADSRQRVVPGGSYAAMPKIVWMN